ncbi:glutaredoxin [Lycium barbarum]|uniref:glutaredoxin n=1 Tax=Lycium barbarum TaxID=112863 RepID=UPI00293F26B0|nr:glutaredoxin [Lycium barbarum]
MGSVFSSPQISKEKMEISLTKAKQIVSSNPVVVFSKTYCGYCTRVKQLLSQLGATFKVIELDRESDGDEVQQALLEWTGQRTVPNVFIGGEHVGGCDSVLAKHQQGKLLPMLKDAAAVPNDPAKV